LTASFVRMPGSALPDLSPYPLPTAVLAVGTGALVSPLLEQAGFWGYGQVVLEQRVRATTPVVLPAALFALLPHPPVDDPFWPKVPFFFLTGITFGTMAYLTNSILPGVLVHALSLLTFFTLVWPHDAARRLVGEGGADAWLWVHVAQAAVFAAVAVLAF